MNKNMIKGKWITHHLEDSHAAIGFRKIFSIKSNVKKAVLYVTSIGNYRTLLNNKKVGKAILTPFYTSYDKRVQIQKYNILNLISKDNELIVEVAPGWGVGRLLWKEKLYRDKVATLCFIKLTYDDETIEYIGSDESFDIVSTITTFSDIYDGEIHDYNFERKCLGSAVLAEDIKTKIILQEGEIVKEQERLSAKKLIITPKGEKVIDFGQNMAGYVEVKIKGHKGDKISFVHGEVLDKEGNFYNDNYRSAKNYIEYTLTDNELVLKPFFSFQGFRYIKLIDYPFDEVDLSSFNAIAVYSDMKRTCLFKCGNKKLNQLYSNIIWGQRSNFIDVPTDCPQRDERLGWLGDAQVFCKTAAINYNVNKFFSKWFGDIRNSQNEDGSLFGYYPTDITKKDAGLISAGWADAVTIIPYQIYKSFGNTSILKKNFNMMKKYINYIYKTSSNKYLWLNGQHYGDWLALDGDGDAYVGVTPTDFIASVFYLQSVRLFNKIGHILNKNVSKFEKLEYKILNEIRKTYVKDGKLSLYTNDHKNIVETQTGYVLAIYFNILKENEILIARDRLNQMIKDNNSRMTTGFLGTPYILHSLSEGKYYETCYDLLLQEAYPSWLYSVNKGATTIWEHYNGIKEDGSFWSTDMNSFNHYAYGAVFDWIFKEAVGIKQEEGSINYENIIITPHPDKRLKYTRISFKTKYGTIKAYWRYHKNKVIYKYIIPHKINAKLILPNGIYVLKPGLNTFEF